MAATDPGQGAQSFPIEVVGRGAEDLRGLIDPDYIVGGIHRRGLLLGLGAGDELQSEGERVRG